MIIVSQNKKVIINFNNVTGIQVEDKNIFVQVVNKDSPIIGQYETEKRAKEVLHEIIKNYECKLLIDFKGCLNQNDEKSIRRFYNKMLNESNVITTDENMDIQYIPHKSIYYMPEE